MFEAYYSKNRFRYIHKNLQKSGFIRYRGNSPIKKTGCFYYSKFNVYIDTSDGVNDDFHRPEYTGRMHRVIEDASGKPFLYLKSIFAPDKTKPLIELASAHGGTVKPFILWHNNPEWYKYTLPRLRRLRKKRQNTTKLYDVGLAASLNPLSYPNPNRTEPAASWRDYYNFNVGSPEDAGFMQVDTRRRLHEKLLNSDLSYDYVTKIPYKSFLGSSFRWRAVLCPPGIGDYSLRFYDAASLGQCVLMRTTTYDYAYSWKPYFAEVNFDAKNWQKAVEAVVNDHKLWGERAEYYFEHFLTPGAITKLFLQNIEKYEADRG